MKTEKIALKNLSYICLYTSNIVESIKFYRDILGLEPTSPEQDISSTDFYSFKTGSTVLALEKNGLKKEEMKTKAENPFLLQFGVSSLEELEKINEFLEENGVKLYIRSKQTGWGAITNFCDPDGNKLEVIFSA